MDVKIYTFVKVLIFVLGHYILKPNRKAEILIQII